MDKRKRKKIVVITACIVVLLGVFLGVEYNKYREKPLLQVIPLSRDEINEVRLGYYSHVNDIALDAQQIAEFWDILADCRVKFWSADRIFPNFYVSTYILADTLPTERRKDLDLSFSSDGRIRVQALPGGRATAYKFIEGEEAVYQFLNRLEGQE